LVFNILKKYLTIKQSKNMKKILFFSIAIALSFGSIAQDLKSNLKKRIEILQ